MAAVAARAPARRRGALRWLLSPQPVRVRPVWVPALAAAAALLVWLAPRRSAPAAPTAPVVAAAAVLPDTVYVHFELLAPRARSVSVAGSFNGWRAGALTMAKHADGLWSVTVPLAVGEHRYDFVVNGHQWVPDPTAHRQVDDGFGGVNSVIVVGPMGVVRS
jgi:Glycogen recognition site of AMP-activated protein kinase